MAEHSMGRSLSEGFLLHFASCMMESRLDWDAGNDGGELW